VKERFVALQVVEVALDRADRNTQPVGQRLGGVTIGRAAKRLADIEQIQTEVAVLVMLEEALRQPDLVLAVAAAKANDIQTDRPGQLCDALSDATIGISVRAIL
jgi:hypothetical protein